MAKMKKKKKKKTDRKHHQFSGNPSENGKREINIFEMRSTFLFQKLFQKKRE